MSEKYVRSTSVDDSTGVTSIPKELRVKLGEPEDVSWFYDEEKERAVLVSKGRTRVTYE